LCPLHHGALGVCSILTYDNEKKVSVVYFEVLSRNLLEDPKKTVEKNTRQAM
jgi:hypothetical protein